MRATLRLSICLVLLLAMLTAPRYASAATATIGGRVTAADTGLPLGSISVAITSPADNIVLHQTYTVADGTYTIWGVSPGQYRVSFGSGGYTHLGEWYNNRRSAQAADTITVADGQALTGINAALERTGVLRGKVTAADTGAGLAGVEVSFYVGATNVGSVYTDSAGDYTSPYQLDPDTDYSVGFNPPDPYNTTYYSGSDTLAGATKLRVAAGATITANTTVVRSGAIKGRVTASDGGAGLPGVTVRVQSSSSWYSTDLQTDADGRYASAGMIPNGSYTVQFIPPSSGVASMYFGEYHDNAASPPQSTPVAITGGITTTVNAVLQRGATISGRVTRSDGGAALPGVSVLVSAAGASGFSAQTDANGVYRTTQPLPAGTYAVCFLTAGAPAPASLYLRECYDDQPGDAQPPPATVSVTAGQSRTGVDAVLERGGAIGGRVTAAENGQPVAGAQVFVYDVADAQAAINSATTAADGSYTTAAPMRTGTFLVEVIPAGGPYLRKFYSGRPSALSADAVAVTTGQTTTADFTLDRGGTIAGQLAGADTGAGLPDVTVNVYNQTGLRVTSTATSDSGSYTTTEPLPAGVYRVEFAPIHTRPGGEFGHLTIYGRSTAYARAFHGGTAGFEGATPISVGLGATTTLNGALVRGGTIAGRVTSAGSAELPGLTVRVYDDCNVLVSEMQPDSAGNYTTPALPSGVYRLAILAGNHRMWFSGGGTSLASAAPINVAAGQATTVDAALTPGAMLSGHVTAGDTGQPLPVEVRILDEAGEQVAMAVSYGGNYSIGYLPSGRYRIKFQESKDEPDYIEMFYGGATTLEAAATVEVPPAGLTGVDMVMLRGGTITGSTTGGGQSLSLLRVRAYDANGRLAAEGTSYNGTYRLSGLPSGAYRLHFDTSTLGTIYASAFYPSAPTLEAATPVSVTAGQTVAANMALQQGGRISGRATDSATGAAAANVSVVIYDAAGNVVDEQQTEENGTYQSGGLPTGAYRLGFNTSHADMSTGDVPTGYAGEYYGGARTLAAATPVQVTLPDTTAGVDLALERGGAITGHLYGEGDGNLYARMVRFYDAAGAIVGTASTDSFGEYQSPPLLPGTYRVQFSDEPHSPLQPTYTYASEFYSSQLLLSAADSVAVSAGRLTPASATLRRAVPICGRLTAEESGAALGGVEVAALSGGEVLASARSDAAGRYRMSVAPGSYQVRFTPGGASGAYRAEYYDNQPSASNAALVPGGTAGVDATLGRGAQFAGTVAATDLLAAKGLAAAAGVAGATVSVYDESGSVVATGVTDASGAYVTAPGVGPGSYRLSFTPPGGSGYAKTYFPLKGSLAEAAPQSVTGAGLVNPSAERQVFLPIARR